MPWRMAPACPGDPAAFDLDLGVVGAFRAGYAERHAHVSLVDGVAEMRLQGSIVDHDLARAGNEPDSRHRGLAAAGPIEESWGSHCAPRQASGSGR